MVHRIYVEKKLELAHEAAALLADLRTFVGIGTLTGLRVLNRYDVEGIGEALFQRCRGTVFSEPQLDVTCPELPKEGYDAVFAVEYLPGQFDQRADSAAQCIQILSQGERPTVRTAKVYLLSGALTAADIEQIKRYVINPVEAREAALEPVSTLAAEVTVPETVEILEGFTTLSRDALAGFLADRGLAMDLDDLVCCRDYFAAERRDPTITEIKVIDTYWSDHCRHTTFHTTLDAVAFDDPALEKAWQTYLDARASVNRTKPVNLMDLGTIAVKVLRQAGKLDQLDESEEINACTVKMNIEVDGEPQDWLLLFKNETHNHPTEIEPFGGAATCIGGAIRDPLSGRSYVYGAVRVTGAADPTKPVSETLQGKLPQRKLTATAAAGYSSYGNQIGLATGQVDELYHPGYAAKRMEVGAVIAAAPADCVRRERPVPGDCVVLLGGRTGRDGCGGATGSSKSHDVSSLETCGAEVQKGNAPEERKLQRLFRNPEASRLIKRCNDFGAGGVSVAVGELADGLDITLDAVPKKYEGLDGTELAISESQERMAVVVAAGDTARFLELAEGENLEATVIAAVKADPRLTMTLHGRTIVDISRAFLDTNGAEKHERAQVSAPQPYEKKTAGSFAERYAALASDLNVCSRRGLSERFDSTIGAGAVFMPFGGLHQLTPVQAMVTKISVERGKTDDCSFMAWGFNPYISEKSPYHGAYLAVVESVCKLIASGAAFEDVYLSFQEYFEKLGHDPRRWGKPVAALLGALEAQLGLGVAAIGGKDSMSGSFMDLDVPPTLISFAVTTGKTADAVSPEFKGPGHRVVLVKPRQNENGLPDAASLRETFDRVTAGMRAGRIVSCWTPGFGGVAEGVMKMCFGNGVGFRYEAALDEDIFAYAYGSFILELAEGADEPGLLLGHTTEAAEIAKGSDRLPLQGLLTGYEDRLEAVFPCNIPVPAEEFPCFSSDRAAFAAPVVKCAKPLALIPVFPGTNCEYDTARAFREAGAEAETFVIRNLSAEAIGRSVEAFAARAREAQIVFIPGGFSGGDEPDGSAKFITSFFRSAPVTEAVTRLLDERGGLMGGICNGFQALIKLGLVPYGKIMETDETCPTLTYNTIGRHQSRLVRTRVCSTLSPWFAEARVGEVYTVPVSHGEGRFLASEACIRQLAAGGQILTQYVDLEGRAATDVRYNPNGSAAAIEGICSPDGRVFGKMGHSERIGDGLYKNVPGPYDLGLFRSAVKFFK